MEEMKFDGSLQAAGYSILHKTVDILGRMLRQRDVTIDMLREQLEAATLEAESESRTAEINRQNDWKECHARYPGQATCRKNHTATSQQ